MSHPWLTSRFETVGIARRMAANLRVLVWEAIHRTDPATGHCIVGARPNPPGRTAGDRRPLLDVAPTESDYPESPYGRGVTLWGEKR
jgi:hypothetical protein